MKTLMKTLATPAVCFGILSNCATLFSRAEAGIISSSGDVDIIAAPPSVLKDALTDPTLTRVFQEQAGHTLTSDLTVNMTAAGTIGGPPFPTIPSLIIPSGTVVDSFFLHFDDVSTNLMQSVGSVTFERPILGLIGRNVDLIASNAELGALGTSYPTTADAIGIWDSPDSVTLSSDLLTLSFDITIGSAIDSIRVVTQPVPEPSSLALCSAALVGWLAFRKALRTPAHPLRPSL